MTEKRPKILAIDDEQDMLLLYKNILKKHFNLHTALSGPEGLAQVKKENFDLVLIDVMMPKMGGVDVLKKLKSTDPDLEVIMVTASKEARPAIDSLKLGAFDYIIKPFEVDDLLATIHKALERRSMQKENTYLKQALDERASFGDLIGKSKKMLEVYGIIENAAKSSSTILITGESGTGKEIVAETIHKKSARNSKPYIVVNCAAIPENLLESEMFGHERGAFTGALDRHIGKFELADGGTIFLDEIGEMPLAMQAKLLRAIQEGKIERVGGEKPIDIDVRIIAATNIDLKKAIKERKFREDLFYRLNVIPIDLPPLRERKEDIPLFIDYFIPVYNKELNVDIKRVTEEAKNALVNYDWPGNVRELENLLERMITLSRKDFIGLEDIPFDIIGATGLRNEERFNIQGTLSETLTNFERKMVADALRAANGNQTNAAKLLGIHRTTLVSKMDSLGLRDSG